MYQAIEVVLQYIQHFDIPIKISIVALALIVCTAVVFSTFLPLVTSILRWLTIIIEKIFSASVGVCMRNWGKVIVRIRNRKGRYPQICISIEDFFVNVAKAISTALMRFIRWKADYATMNIWVAIVCLLLILSIVVFVWIVPITGEIAATYYQAWEQECIEKASRPVTRWEIGVNQMYYQLTGNDANILHEPGGAVIARINSPHSLLRDLGGRSGSWIQISYFENDLSVSGWIHQSLVQQWDSGDNTFTLLKTDHPIKISALGIPGIKCTLIGITKATDDGTITILLERK